MTETRRVGLWLLAIVVFALCVYAPAITYDFVDDDTLQIVRNPILRSWRFLPDYFGDAWSHKKLIPGMPMMAYYRPAFLLWLAANYHLVGPSPAAFHATSLLLHAGTLLLVFLVVAKLSKSHPLALLTTLLFAVHPAHIEAVTWVSGATETLVALPLLGSFFCYLQAREAEPERRARWTYVSVALYFIALLSKETAIVFPAVLFVHSWLFDKHSSLGRLVPYGAVIGLYGVMRILAGVDVNAHHTTASTSTLLLTLPSVIWFYISHLMWPFGLSTVYDLPLATELSVRGVILPLTALLAMAAALALWSKRNALVAFAAFWFAILLGPPLYLRALPPREIAHDRYLYLPSIGFCLLIALLLDWLRSRNSPSLRSAAFITAGGVALLWACGLLVQNRVWANDVTLFRHAYKVAPGNPRSLWQYSLFLARNDHCAEAIPLLKKTLERKRDADAYYALGVCHFKESSPSEAERALRSAIAVTPDFQEPYVLIAMMRLQERQVAAAEAIIAEADRARTHGIEPPGLNLVRGEIFASKGEWDAAAESFRKEVAYEPPMFRREALSDLQELQSRVPRISVPEP